MAQRSNYLVEIQAFTGDQVETLYLSTQPFTSRPDDDPPNQRYRAAIADLGSFDRSFAEDDGAFGPGQVNYGFVSLNNTNGQFDGWQFYAFGREFVIKELIDPRAYASTATVIFRGVIQGVDTSDAKNTLRLRVRDRMALLDKPLLTTRYAGTTTGSGPTAEGNTELKDVIKPRIWGSPYKTVKCKPVNTFNLLYQVSNSEVDSIVVDDEGIALTNDGDEANLTALNAATIVGAHYKTCLALGIFRLGARAAGLVSAIVTEGGNAENRSAIRVAQRILEFYGETVDTASFDAIYGDITDQVGIQIDDETTARAAVAKVLASIEAGIIPTIDGTLQAVRLVDPSGETEETTLTEADLDKDGDFSFSAGPLTEGDGIPAWSVIVNWGEIFQTQQGGDLAASVSDQDKAILALQRRPAKAEDAGIIITYPNAPQIVTDTLLNDPTNAGASAARRLALYGTIFRRGCSFPVQRERADYPVGSVLRVDMSRFGFAGGVNMLVKGRRDDFMKQRVTYRLWG